MPLAACQCLGTLAIKLALGQVFLSPCHWGFSLTLSGELRESYPVLAFRKFYSLNTTVSYPRHLWGFPGGSDG